VTEKKNIHRCSWADNDPLMRAYHDEEWGVPERDSRALWEALMLDADIERLLQNEGIIRSRAKIEATINGARIYVAMADAGEDFSSYIWKMAGNKPIQNAGPVPAKTPLSEEISAALKRRGFKFVGPVIVYAWMQAVGIVNDHSPDCFRRKKV
jgi:DNA-3-methyladenine glycosylase I